MQIRPNIKLKKKANIKKKTNWTKANKTRKLNWAKSEKHLQRQLWIAGNRGAYSNREFVSSKGGGRLLKMAYGQFTSQALDFTSSVTWLLM